MFFFTIWGGSDVRPRDPDNIVITVWGGTDILLPTLAEKIIRLNKAKTEDGEITDAVIRRTNVITVMGGTVYKTPTLAKEIEEMRQLKESGTISQPEMLQLWQEAIRRGDLDHFESLTIMGGAEEEAPARKEELKDLDRIVARGVISSKERDEIRSLLEKNLTLESEEMQQKLISLIQPSGSYTPLQAPVANSALFE